MRPVQSAGPGPERNSRKRHSKCGRGPAPATATARLPVRGHAPAAPSKRPGQTKTAGRAGRPFNVAASRPAAPPVALHARHLAGRQLVVAVHSGNVRKLKQRP